MLNTYYWKLVLRPAAADLLWRGILRRPWKGFVHGNAGDIFNETLYSNLYPNHRLRMAQRGPRLLSVGSIAHCVTHRDIVCGIGCKSSSIKPAGDRDVQILALRGPLSYRTFKAAGYKVDSIRFLLDPGLMIRFFVGRTEPRANNVIFIPHFAERGRVLRDLPESITYVDVDCRPEVLAKKIQEAELVYSSSLHGLIFAHALERPCVFVRPSSGEPLFKYQDYYLSLSLAPPKPLDSIDKARFASAPTSAASLSFSREDFSFPTERELIECGAISG